MKIVVLRACRCVFFLLLSVSFFKSLPIIDLPIMMDEWSVDYLTCNRVMSCSLIFDLGHAANGNVKVVLGWFVLVKSRLKHRKMADTMKESG